VTERPGPGGLLQWGVASRAALSCAAVFWAVLAAACVVGVGCGDQASAGAAETCPVLASECSSAPSYTNEVAPIFASRCASCHTSADPLGPWPFDDIVDIQDWSSTILVDLDSCLMPPPDASVGLSADERAVLGAWIVCGSPDN
jgi:uncharacterized membrane protein